MFIKIGWLNFLLSIACRDGTESERTRNELSFKWAEQKTNKQTNKKTNKNDMGFCSNCRSVVRRVYGFRCCFEETAAAATPSSDNEPPVKEILWDIGHSGEEKKKSCYILFFFFFFFCFCFCCCWHYPTDSTSTKISTRRCSTKTHGFSQAKVCFELLNVG